jgi:outer membrane protein
MVMTVESRRAIRLGGQAASVSLAALMAAAQMFAQTAPPNPAQQWKSDALSSLQWKPPAGEGTKGDFDPGRTYTLAELIDAAERHNPQTRVAWERARAEAALLGVARSALYPTLAAVALAEATRQRVLFSSDFYRQTLETIQSLLAVHYTIFDFGARKAEIDFAKANLLSANLDFNNAHLRIILRVTDGYYRLLRASGQQTAATADFASSRTAQDAVEARLTAGLATLPDALQARATTAQADYELASVRGEEDIARGELATALGIAPTVRVNVQDIGQLAIPDAMLEPVERMIDRALSHRPDLLAQVAELRAAEAQIRSAQSTFRPTLSVSGNAGAVAGCGRQDLLKRVCTGGETWDAQFNLQWNVFDGHARRERLAQAQSARTEAQARLETSRDEAADRVWMAYANARTSLRRRESAARLLEASEQSYAATLDAYENGVRNFVDVAAALRTLAQARTFDVTARTQVLEDFAQLAFETGDLLRNPAPGSRP